MTSPHDNQDHDHDNDHSHDTTTTRVGALVAHHPGWVITPVGPGKDTHGSLGPLRRKAVGGPTPTPQMATVKMQWRVTQTVRHTCLPTNMVAEPVTTNNVDDQPAGAEDCRGTTGTDRED